MFDIRYKSHHDVKDVISTKVKRRLKLPSSYWSLMNQYPKDKDGGIYVHVPFCDKICSFCNMNRKQLDNDLEDYTNFLVKEIERYRDKPYIKNKLFSVIFFGGGTPTILKPHQLERVLKTLREVFPLNEKDYEFTFETTLHNLTDEKLKIMQSYGVNRLSVGIQTFSDRGRKILNRTYSKVDIIEKLKKLKEQFNGLVCIDIIYNYSNETLEEVNDDVKAISEILPDSVSFYSLMIHEGSKLSKDLGDYKYQLETDRELHDNFLNKMREIGYNVLEFTKLSKGTDRYLYIKNVHNLKDLIPIGIGAGGRVQDMEIFHLNKYITFYAQYSEKALKMKRLSGIIQYDYVYFKDLEEIFGENFEQLKNELFSELEKERYIEVCDNYIKFTDKGIFWGNNISALFVEKFDMYN